MQSLLPPVVMMDCTDRSDGPFVNQVLFGATSQFSGSQTGKRVDPHAVAVGVSADLQCGSQEIWCDRKTKQKKD